MSRRFTHKEMAAELQMLVYSKRAWLTDFGNGSRKRPDHEIETRRRELEVLEQAAHDYQRAAARKTA